MVMPKAYGGFVKADKNRAVAAVREMGVQSAKREGINVYLQVEGVKGHHVRRAGRAATRIVRKAGAQERTARRCVRGGAGP